MRIGKKLFPYPVLREDGRYSGYKNSEFTLEYTEVEDDKNLYFKDVYINLINPTLKKLLNDKKADAVMVIECSETLFRRTFSVSSEKQDIVIPLTDLRGDVFISCFVYALENINNYSNPDFLDVYSGYQFEIEKYNILAANDGYRVKIDYDFDQDKKIASIFKVIKSEDMIEEQLKVTYNSRLIIIYMPSKQFNFYETLKNNDHYQNIFFSIIAIPALSYCLQDLQKKTIEVSEAEMDYSWFKSLKNAYEIKYNLQLTDDLFMHLNTYEVSQDILNNGSVKAIEDIFNIIMGSLMGDDYDE